jgi:competence protein ComEC
MLSLKTFIRKYPALITAFPFAFGIAVSYYSGIDLSFLSELPLVILLAATGFSVILIYRTASNRKPFFFTFLALLLLYGFLSFQLKYFLIDVNSIGSFIEREKEFKTVLKGTITERPDSKDDRIRLLLGNVTIEKGSFNGNVLVTIYKNRFRNETQKKFEYGDVIEIEGKLEDLPHRRNPGEFDYGEYLRLHDINAVFTAFGYDEIRLHGYDPPGFYTSGILIPVKEYSIRVIDDLVGGDEGEYLKGLVLGERSNITRETKENFVNAGVAHIIAVSGLNVAYVMIILWGILTFIPVRQIYKIFTTVLFLIFYMNLTGNTPSIIRATIMASIFLLAQVVERKPNTFNIVSAAALVILLIDPRQLFDAGFILSFSAILSILIIYPVLDNWLNNFKWYQSGDDKKIHYRALRWAAMLFAGTLAAQLGTLPITAIMFRKISLISLMANLVAIPLSNFTLGLGFIMIFASLISGWLASVFASLNIFLLHSQLVFIEFCAKLDYSFVETYFVDWLLFVFYYLALWQLLVISKQNFNFRIAVLMLLGINFYVWKAVLNKTDEAEITYLDTGTSATALLTMPQGTSILINAGSSTEKYSSAERNIIPYLKAKGITGLDLLIITSLNKNEFRSLKYLQENFDIKRIYVPAFYRPVFLNSDIASSFNRPVIEFVSGHRLLNRNGNFRIYLYYDSLLAGSSMMTEFSYGNRNFVFAAPKDRVESAFNTSIFQADSRIAVLNLKGNFEVVSTDFIAGLDPQYVVVPGAIGKKKQENEFFAETLEKFGCSLSNTAGSGAVIFRTDGEAFRKIKW